MPINLAEYYDCVINWERRLAREMPLLEELARKQGSAPATQTFMTLRLKTQMLHSRMKRCTFSLPDE